MNLNLVPWLILFILIFFQIPVSSVAQQIALNEIMASNATTIADEDGDYEDWIEIYNYGNTPVNLSGYGLSDDYDRPFRWIFPDVTIQPSEFLLVWASNKGRSDPAAPMHTNFAISSGGEEILLTAPDSTRIDELAPTEIPTDISYGRFPDGIGEWGYFKDPTPGTSNIGDQSSEMLEPVHFTHKGGFYTSPFELVLSHPDPDATIIYTLDGSEPDIHNLGGTTYQYKNQYPYRRDDPFGPFLTQTYTSLLYESSLLIQDRSNEPDKLTQISSTSHYEPGYFPESPVRKGTVVRARAYKPDAISSHLTGHTYFVWDEGNPYQIPVISIQTNENYLFDYDIGIYNAGVDYDTWRTENPDVRRGNRPEYGNYWRRGIEWEYPANIEIFSPDGFEAVMNQGAGIRTHGNFSRILPIKNMRLYARGQYGTENEFEHALFNDPIPNVPNPNNNLYNRILMRGDGAGGPVFYDVVFNRLMQPVFDGVTRIQPAIHFINGEYWGITAIRDRMDRHHFSYFYDQEPDNIHQTNCKGFNCETVSGNRSVYNELRFFIRDNNMRRSENYEHVKSLMCISSYADQIILNIFSGNTHYERRLWRVSETNDSEYGDGIFRFLVQDFESTLRTDNWLSHWAGIRSNDFLIGKLLENRTFREYFINRFADHLNTTFKTERFRDIINHTFEEHEPYIEETVHRQSRDLGYNEYRKRALLRWAEEHPDRQRSHILEHFNLSTTIDLIIDNSFQERSPIKVNSILISQETPGISANPYPWTGTYFSGIPITLSAPTHPGVEFNHWQINGRTVYDAVVELLPDTVQSVKAVYDESGIEDIEAYQLASGTYLFDEWDEDAEAGSYPPHMAFVFMDQADPGQDARVAGMTFGEYSLDSRTRMVGLGDEGFAFINTGNPDGNPGYPGTRLGGAVLVLDTREVNGAEVGFKAGTVRPNSRVYNLRLQYRIGSEGAFTDVLDGEGNPVEYLRSGQEGHNEFIGPVALPPDAIGRDRVELLWRYYHTGEQLDPDSGQRAMINLSSIHVAVPGDPMKPQPHVLTNNPYEFSNWPADSPQGSAPPSMGFVYMNSYDPGPDAEILGFTSGAFALESRTRVEGLGEDGFAFINTSNLKGNPGYPGRRLGGAVLNLNTEGQGSVTIQWAAGTVLPNSRIYNLRLQYRTSPDEAFRDVLDTNGNPLEYQRFEEDNHRQGLGPVVLPGDADDQPWVQLFWRYYYTGEREDEESGQRSMLNISGIRVHSYALLGGEPGIPAEFHLYQNYPNPFYPASTIRFDLPRDQHVRIDLYTITGRRVATLEDRPLSAGRHSVQVDASGLASGVYLYRLLSDDFTETGKLSVIK